MQILKLQITKLMSDAVDDLPLYSELIADRFFMRLPIAILCDGGSQVGKTVWCKKELCERYDKHYLTMWEIDDFLNYYDGIESELEIEKTAIDGTEKTLYHVPKKYIGRWILFEEPENEVPKSQFWSDRNTIMLKIANTQGFLRNAIVMPLPDIRGLSDLYYKNICFRATINAKCDKQHTEIKRICRIKIPLWNEYRKKYYWDTIHRFYIPYIPEDKIYNSDKIDFFFHKQLSSLKEQRGIESKWNNSIANAVGEAMQKKTDEWVKPR
jgi:hypothetical protein